MRILRFFRKVEQAHIEAADMVDIILDVVRRARGRALAFENFVGAVSAHVAIYIQLMVAHRTAAVASPAKLLIICNGPLCTFASH